GAARPDEFLATPGFNAAGSPTAPKLMGLRPHEPEIWPRARSCPPVGGYVLGWLTGVLAQDHANASSTLLYDVRTGDWDPGLLDAAGLDPAFLAPIRPSAAPAGTPTPEAATQLPLTTASPLITPT